VDLVVLVRLAVLAAVVRATTSISCTV